MYVVLEQALFDCRRVSGLLPARSLILNLGYFHWTIVRTTWVWLKIVTQELRDQNS